LKEVEKKITEIETEKCPKNYLKFRLTAEASFKALRKELRNYGV